MFRNRISSLHEDSLLDWCSARAQSEPAATVAMVAVPNAVAPTSWQAQLYQLAYQRAVEDVSRARRFNRFFSVWN